MRILIFALALGVFFVASIAPIHANPAVRQSAGLVLAVLILWISEVAPLGVTALIIPVAASFAGLLTWPEALRAWGDSTVFLFLGTFLLARAIDKHGAFHWLLDARWARGATGPAALALLVLLISGALSTVQNNTAVTAMLLPVVLPLARRTAMPAVPLIALAWGATFGGMAAPVGTAPNFIGYDAIKKLDAGFSFVTWLRVGLPVWIGTTLIGGAVLAFAARVARARVAARRDRGPLSPLVVTDVGPAIEVSPDMTAASPRAIAATPAAIHARYISLLALAAAAAIWLTCGFIKSAYDRDHPAFVWVDRYLPESLVPIACAWLLFLIRPARDAPTILDRHDFQALDWDTLFLIAGGLCLGTVMEKNGAALAFADTVAALRVPPLLLMLAVAGGTVLLSELTSNTATASLMVPIAGALAPILGVSPVQAIWLVALAASLGFVLPVSTPPNALVYGTRLVPLRFMAATGIVIDALATVWVVLCIRWFG